MSKERRQRPRVTQPLEGNWHGASGSTRCRISDVSESGCFVQSMMPSPGEKTTVSISIGQSQLTLPGTIVYAERGMGFAMKFDTLGSDDAAALAELVALLAEDSAGGQ
jgi:hypothetical protein